LTREKIKIDQELQILINCITNDRFLQEIIPIVRSTYFKLGYSKLLWQWIQEYFENFACAPKKDITNIYKQKYAMLKDDDESNDAIKLFLSNLSKKYEEYSDINNIDFLLKESIHYLAIRSGEILKEKIEDALLSNDKDKLENAISSYKRVEKPTGQGIDLLHDHNKILEALTKERNVLLTYPGAVGNVIPPICRGDFMAFFGPAKRGKSYFLWDSSELLMSQANKVIFIPLEMNESAIIKRVWPSIIGQPLYDRDVRSAHFEDDGNGKFDIVQDSKFIKGASLDNIEDMQKKLRRLYRKGRIKIIPMVGATCQMIESICDNLYYYENFIPDAIVIDYADYMEAGGKYTDNRDRINKIWKGLRDLANERNIAIITASHTEKKTFNEDIKTSQASEDIRKINHVTLAVSLNATDKENENNIIRLGMMEIREGRHIADQAVVLQCLDLGRPCIDSKMKKEVNGYNNSEEKKQYRRKFSKDDV